MRMIVAAAVLLCVVSTLPVLAEDVDLSGEWQISLKVFGRESVYTATLVQTGKKLTVSFTKPGGDTHYEGTGSVKGDQVQWTLTVPGKERPHEVVYTGTVRSKVRMRGKVQFTGGSQAHWIGDRAGSE